MGWRLEEIWSSSIVFISLLPHTSEKVEGGEAFARHSGPHHLWGADKPSGQLVITSLAIWLTGKVTILRVTRYIIGI